MRVTAHISSISWDADGEVIEDLPRSTTVEFDADFSSNMGVLLDLAVDALFENYGWDVYSYNTHRLEIELD